MSDKSYRRFPCDLCGSETSSEVPHCREYTNDQAIDICSGCGFVFVRDRRSARRIAQDWSEEIFGAGYTARIPHVKARQTFVAEFLDTELGVNGRRVCDIGAGEGQFLQILKGAPYHAEVFGIEPSAANDKLLTELEIPHYTGTIEEFSELPERDQSFDVVTVMWTLENCESCIRMLEAAHGILRPEGHILVATGSRILVPFKKPLHYYLSTNPADTHCFRFSANTLRGALSVAGFETVAYNRYIDNDVLLILGRRSTKGTIDWPRDDPDQVADFFRRWHEENRHYVDA